MKFKQNLEKSFKESWKMSILITLLTWITTMAIKYFNLLFVTGSIASDVQSQFSGGGIAPYIGVEFINFLNMLDINLIAIFIMFVGSYLLVMSGKIIVNAGAWQLNFLGRKGRMITRIYSELFYGALVLFTLVLTISGMLNITTVLASLIYYLYIAIVAGFLSINDNIERWLSR